MTNEVKNYIKHSFVYGISKVLQKASGIILLPLYTKYLTTAEFGQFGILLSTIIIASQIITLGLDQAVIRYSNIEEENNKRGRIFFNLFSVLIIFCAIGYLAASFFIANWGSVFIFEEAVLNNLTLTLYIIIATAVSNFLSNKMRADEKSSLYTISGVAKLIIILAAVVYYLVINNGGLTEILLAQLYGELIAIVILLPFCLKGISFKIDQTLIKTSIKFGLPLIFSSLGMNLLNWSDRYVLKIFTNYSEVGLYEFGYKIAGVLNMFIIVPFSLTLLPISYKYYKKENDKLFYKNILTYFSFILFFCGLGISLFGGEIISVLALEASYYPSQRVVPVLILSYIFFGISLVTTLGLYLTAKTNYVAVYTVVCVATNIVLNFLLIPEFGMMAAAANTAIAFLVLIILTTTGSNKFYKIDFEFGRIFKLFIISSLIYFASLLIDQSNILISISLKTLLLFLYLIILYMFNFFKKEEILEIKKLLNVNSLIKK